MKIAKFTMWSMAALALAACSDSEEITDVPIDEAAKPEWYYTGGELGTAYLTTANAYEQPTPAVENAGLMTSFLNGEALFE
ncbi:MAG: hypothetical protein ACI4UC_01865, partial [Alloprevotella sp.]